MNKIILYMKHLSFFLYLAFVFIAIYFFAKENRDLAIHALIWASAYIIFEYGFLSILKSRLLDVRQKKYKIVFLYENPSRTDEMVKKVNEMKEIRMFLDKPNVSSCNLMDYEVYQRLNPTFTILSFPYYLVINGEDLIDEGILLKKPLYHHSSIDGVIGFLSKHESNS